MSSRGFPVRTRSYVSSSPRLADVDGDGRDEIVVGGDALRVLRLDGVALPGWPRRGRRPFASSPAVADLDGDGRPEIVCGCDDHRVYAFRADGSPLPGWPVRTGLDVYSSPTITDLDGDGRPEVIVGSDDGRVHAFRADGSPLPRWPVATGHFVAASPAVADLDGDGRPEVVATSWDGFAHAWRADGSPLPGWPVPLGRMSWASPLVADVDGDGKPEVVVATDEVRVLRGDGSLVAGWPQPLGSLAVAKPALVDGALVQCADRIYAWRPDGAPLPGFPVDVGAFAWGAPAIADLDGDGRDEIVVGAWDGRVHALDLSGRFLAGFPLATRGPVFASPALARVGNAWRVISPSWDCAIHAWDTRVEKGARVAPPAPRAILAARPPRHREPTWLRVAPGQEDLRRARVTYEIEGEGREHPVPVWRSGDAWWSLVQPLAIGHRVHWRLADARDVQRATGTITVGGAAGAAARPALSMLRALVQRR